MAPPAEVTGSCHLLAVGNQRILLDCGLIQGGRKDKACNRVPFPFDPKSIDAVVLSYLYIDAPLTETIGRFFIGLGLPLINLLSHHDTD